MLTIMLVDISRNIRENEIKSGNRYDKNIRKAINYIHLHFKNNLNLNEVAKITYFSRLFKEKYNTTPRLYRELNSNTTTQFHEPIDYKIE